MDVEDDTRDGSASSIILESLESTQQGEKLSDEDLAWVNSCLVSDTEILESNWTSFKDVLLEIIGDQPETLDPSVTKSYGNLGGTEISIVPSIEEEEAANYLGRTDDNLLIIPVNGDNETNTVNIPIKMRTGTKQQYLQEDSSETFRGDPFRPTYKEEKRKDNEVDLGIQSILSAEDTNSSTVDIFRVWDLDIPDYLGRTDDNLLIIPVNGDNETNTGNIPIKKRTGTKQQYLQEDSSETFRGDPFRPTYKEEERKDNEVDLGIQSILSAEDTNSSTVDIFRVWDLDIPDYLGRTDDNLLIIPVNGDNETNTGNIPIKKRTGSKQQYLQEDSSETFRGDPFRPTYKEEERKDNEVDLGIQSILSAEDTNSSTIDIFRVWDLDIPDEEDDLIKELNKVAAKTTPSFQSMPLAFESSTTAWKDLEDEPLDDIIAGIADLSLNTQKF